MASMNVPDTVLLIIHTLAVARVTGLIVSDSLTEGLRDAAIGWLDDRPRTLGKYLATLIQCPWCAGMWVSLLAAPLVWFWCDSPALVLVSLPLALNQVTGMIASVGR